MRGSGGFGLFAFVLSIPLTVVAGAPAPGGVLTYCDDPPPLQGQPLGGGQPLQHLAARRCGGGGGGPQPPVPACWSATSQTLIGCDDALANDYCDSNPQQPWNGYLRDGWWDGDSCGACVPTEQTCGDGFDDDCDGRIDCADPDCIANYACSYNAWAWSCGTFVTGIDYGGYETDCYDALDNDGDGHTDCLDRDCLYGPDCAPLGDSDCICPDLDGDGTIFHDWDDVARAVGTADHDLVYRCAQIWDPFCTDSETREFLEWMRDRSYTGRVIAIHADDANDPVKRETGTGATFQDYYNLRNDDPFGNGVLPHQVDAFKNDPVFEIEFIQVVATDADIVNEINTEADVLQYFLPYFRDQIYGRQIAVVYSQELVSYGTTFGPHFPCANNPAQACFSTSAMSAWVNGLMSGRIAVLHWGGKALTDGTPIQGYAGCQTCSQNAWKVQTASAHMSHEFGHFLTLQHPLSTYPYDLYQNVNNALGTTGVMANLGYVYGSVWRLAPLERYGLEPAAGYADAATFGPAFSAEVSTCD